ncbi:MAG: MAPEG family protein [Stenotrophobium sp.]
MPAMTGMTALLLFTAWTLLLMFTYVGYRVVLVFAGKKKANAWTRGTQADDPGFIVRASHAHVNCTENLPVFAAIVLAAWALNKSAVVDHVAIYFLAARVAQSLVHLIGVSHWLVFLRGNLFIAQALLCFYRIWGLLA